MHQVPSCPFKVNIFKDLMQNIITKKINALNECILNGAFGLRDFLLNKTSDAVHGRCPQRSNSKIVICYM